MEGLDILIYVPNVFYLCLKVRSSKWLGESLPEICNRNPYSFSVEQTKRCSHLGKSKLYNNTDKLFFTVLEFIKMYRFVRYSHNQKTLQCCEMQNITVFGSPNGLWII